MTYVVTVVCTGNICRSPMAEVLLREALEAASLDVAVDSAGTGGWHVGEDMDPRARAELEDRGHEVPRHVARRINRADFTQADLLLAADSGHYEYLTALAPDDGAASKVHLLRAFDPQADDEDVPDPYYGDRHGFAETYAIITAAMPGVVQHVREHS